MGSPSMGSPQGASRRRLARPFVVTGVVALVVGAAAGVAAAVNGAATPPPTASQSAATATPSAAPVPGRWHGFAGPKSPRFGGFAFAGPGALGAVHGEFVVPKSGGGYQTIDTQRGSVTAVSSTSITVKSADGFTKTYPVTSGTIVDSKRDGISSIKVGDQALITATVSGSTATAANIVDITNLQHQAQQFFQQAPPPASSTG
ncbi:MAG: hypothetical protein ACM3ML_16870 [Micromonosporaceae bacterium]